LTHLSFKYRSIDIQTYATYLPSLTLSYRLRLRINRCKISFALKGFKDIGLLIQHKTIRLFPNLCQASPTLEISGIAFVAMSFLRMFPMALTER
jgi:hypothetical protein